MCVLVVMCGLRSPNGGTTCKIDYFDQSAACIGDVRQEWCCGD